MTEDASFIFSGVVLQNGSNYDSYCLDMDVSSAGATVDEARANLLLEVEKSFKLPAEIIAKSPAPKSNKGFTLMKEFVVDEFYFRHSLSSLGNTTTQTEISEKKSVRLKSEFDSDYISINKT